MRARAAAIAACATIAIAAAVLLASSAAAVQTFPDPFGGEGIHSDIRAGSRGDDIGDAFFLREDDVFSIRMFLDAPNAFIASHVCLSAEPFTRRIAPGQCQYEATGGAAGTYDITLPPDSFPLGAEPFDDPLGAFCAQVHVKYSAPGLARTLLGGGSAFAGWESGSPFFGSLCFPSVPDPEPPGEGTAEVSKAGAFVAGDVVFTVTVSNPTTFVAPGVVVWDALPPTLTWTTPPDCALGPGDAIARCAIGDLAGGASLDLVFSATPAADQCGAFSNHASTFLGRAVASSVSLAIVEVPCPPDPEPDPLILFTKEPTATQVTAPGSITYILTFENAGPGSATDVSVTDELPAGADWSIGSGSNVCSIPGKTLSCFAESVPDGVFEVLELTGTVAATDCGAMDNEGTVAFSGGPEPGSVTAISETVEVTGCPAPTPTPPSATSPAPSESAAAGGEGDGDEGALPDTATTDPSPMVPIGILAAFALFAGAVLLSRFSRR